MPLTCGVWALSLLLIASRGKPCCCVPAMISCARESAAPCARPFPSHLVRRRLLAGFHSEFILDRWSLQGVNLPFRVIQGLYWGYIGRMENNSETAI